MGLSFELALFFLGCSRTKIKFFKAIPPQVAPQVTPQVVTYLDYIWDEYLSYLIYKFEP